MLNEFKPDFAVSPGEVLSFELDLRGMNQQELSRRTGLTPKHIVSIIKAKSMITPETAIKLERAIGMPAEFWLNLEAHYSERKARLVEEIALSKDLGWLKKIPLASMIKLGWVKKTQDSKSQLNEILKFFGIANVHQWSDIWANLKVAYRRHGVQTSLEGISAWLRRGEIEASLIQCEPFDRNKFRAALDEIRQLTKAPLDIFLPEMKKLCAASGVAVVFVPSLPKLGVSGATRWINPNKAIIQLSLRYKTDDHLWFTFFHEAGHIMLHGKKELFLEGGNGLDQNKEAEANLFAEHELISPKDLADFIQLNQFSKTAINQFSKKVGISAGIVVGQLQHKGVIPRNYCNDLKRSFSWKLES